MSEPATEKRRTILADGIILAMTAHAKALGVSLHVEHPEPGRLTFAVRRKADTPKGNAALAIGALLELADAAGIEVVIDVKRESHRLVSYYHDFGFRLVDSGALGEAVELAAMELENERCIARGGRLRDLGVVTMFREPWTGPLVWEEEVRSIMGTQARILDEEGHRDLMMAVLHLRGHSAHQAGCRVSPGIGKDEAFERMKRRQAEGWNIPLFAQPLRSAA